MKQTIAGLMLTFAAVTVAYAQTARWPDKPVRVIVPFPAGGTNDVIARTFAPKLTEEYGQQFIVNNRAGAGGGERAPSTPDGFARVIAQDVATWTKVVRDGNIKLN